MLVFHSINISSFRKVR